MPALSDIEFRLCFSIGSIQKIDKLDDFKCKTENQNRNYKKIKKVLNFILDTSQLYLKFPSSSPLKPEVNDPIIT